MHPFSQTDERGVDVVLKCLPVATMPYSPEGFKALRFLLCPQGLSIFRLPWISEYLSEMCINLEYILQNHCYSKPCFFWYFRHQIAVLFLGTLPTLWISVLWFPLRMARRRVGGPGVFGEDWLGWLELFARELAAASLERRQGDSVGTLRDFPERLAIFATLEISAVRV